MFNKLVLAAAGLIAIAFVSVCARAAWGPVRYGEDVGAYLSVAEAIEAGQPFDAQERPIGYPLVLAGLHHLGITGNAGRVGFNVFCLAVGLAAFAAIAHRDLGLASWEIACLVSWTLCSKIVFELVTYAQPECVYVATSLGAVLCLLRSASSRRQAAWIAAAAALIAASIALRTIGIALVPAFLWMFRSKLRNPLWTTAALVAGCVGLAWIRSTQYTGIFPLSSYSFTHTNAALFILDTVVRWRLQTVFSVFTNIRTESIGTLPWLIRQEAAYFGLLFFLPVLVGTWKCRRSPLAVYLAVYCAIVFMWPFSYTRFLMPVVPCLFAFAWFAIRDVWRQVHESSSIRQQKNADSGPADHG